MKYALAVVFYSYGYRNVYELAPLIDLKASKLTFELPFVSRP